MNLYKVAPDVNQCQFWISRGSTFTDVIVKKSDGHLASKRLLSKDNEHLEGPDISAIKELLNIGVEENVAPESVRYIEAGAAVVNNAILEYAGKPTVLAVTAGLESVVNIENKLTKNHSVVNNGLAYNKALGIRERIAANGNILTTIDLERTRHSLAQSYNSGYRSIAIILMNASKYSEHEEMVAELATQVGFREILTSVGDTPVAKLLTQNEVPVIETYLVPILRQYINKITEAVDG